MPPYSAVVTFSPCAGEPEMIAPVVESKVTSPRINKPETLLPKRLPRW